MENKNLRVLLTLSLWILGICVPFYFSDLVKSSGWEIIDFTSSYLDLINDSQNQSNPNYDSWIEAYNSIKDIGEDIVQTKSGRCFWLSEFLSYLTLFKFNGYPYSLSFLSLGLFLQFLGIISVPSYNSQDLLKSSYSITPDPLQIENSFRLISIFSDYFYLIPILFLIISIVHISTRNEARDLFYNTIKNISEIESNILNIKDFYNEISNILNSRESFINNEKQHEKSIIESTTNIDILIQGYSDCSMPESKSRISNLISERNKFIKKYKSPWDDIIEELVAFQNSVAQHQSSQNEWEQFYYEHISNISTQLSSRIVHPHGLEEKPHDSDDCICTILLLIFKPYDLPIPLNVDLDSFKQDIKILQSNIESVNSYLSYEEENNFNKEVDSFFVDIQILKESFKNRLESIQKDYSNLLNKPSVDAAGFILARNLEWYELPMRTIGIGSTGAGKSMFLEMIIKPIYKAISRRKSNPVPDDKKHPLRVLIFDVDGDTLPILEGVGISSQIRFFLNPYDERSEDESFFGWATGHDLNSRRAIKRFSEIIISDIDKNNKDSNHFREITRQVLQVVMIRLRENKGSNWTLYEALYRIFNRELLEEDLKQGSFHYEDLYDAVFSRQEHGADTISTIWAELQGYRDISALWHQRSGKISIRKWLETSSVLVLPWQGDSSTSMSKLNQALIGIFSDIVTKELPNINYPATTIVVDEATLLAPLPGVDKLCTYGRKKGVSVYIAFQSIPEAIEKFGEGNIKAILGQCDVQALLANNCPDTAKWMAARCGEFMKDEYLTDISEGESSQKSTSKSSSNTEGTTQGQATTSGNSSSHGTNWQRGYDTSSTGGFESSGYNNSQSHSSGTQNSNTSGESIGSSTSKSKNTSTRQKRERQPRIEYTEFLDMNKATRRVGLSGIVIAPNLDTANGEIHKIRNFPASIIDQARPQKTNAPGFIMRDENITEDMQREAYQDITENLIDEDSIFKDLVEDSD